MFCCGFAGLGEFFPPAGSGPECFVVLLVQRDVGLLALRSQGQTALLQLRLGVVPVLIQDELLQHTEATREPLPHPPSPPKHKE